MAQREHTPRVQIVDLITTNKDKKFAPVGRMATAIMGIISEDGDCLPIDIRARGFTPSEISKYWHMAYSLATVEMNLMSNHPTNIASIIRRK